MPYSEIEQIYAQHERWLQRWLARKLGDAQTAEDVTQDVFVRLLTRQDTATVHTPRAMLLTIAQRVLISRWRQEQCLRRQQAALSDASASAVLSAERHAQGREALRGGLWRLRGLSSRTREIFILRRQDGLPLADIAARLGLSVATVKRELAHVNAVCLRDTMDSNKNMSQRQGSCDS